MRKHRMQTAMSLWVQVCSQKVSRGKLGNRLILLNKDSPGGARCAFASVASWDILADRFLSILSIRLYAMKKQNFLRSFVNLSDPLTGIWFFQTLGVFLFIHGILW